MKYNPWIGVVSVVLDVLFYAPTVGESQEYIDAANAALRANGGEEVSDEPVELFLEAKNSKKSGKEKASDVPSWAEGEKPLPGESGRDFAKRLLDKKY